MKIMVYLMEPDIERVVRRIYLCRFSRLLFLVIGFVYRVESRLQTVEFLLQQMKSFVQSGDSRSAGLLMKSRICSVKSSIVFMKSFVFFMQFLICRRLRESDVIRQRDHTSEQSR